MRVEIGMPVVSPLLAVITGFVILYVLYHREQKRVPRAWAMGMITAAFFILPLIIWLMFWAIPALQSLP